MKSILLIEDNIDILENLGEFLELEGYYILSANDEKTGIEMAIQFMPDLIICDCPRPGIDGHEVLRMLIKTSKISGIPFIFCSTMSETSNSLAALQLGADDYIIKPFELDNVLAVVKASIAAGSKRQKYIL